MNIQRADHEQQAAAWDREVEQHGDRVIRLRDLDAVIETLVDVMRDMKGQHVKEIQALEQRIAVLEARPTGLKYVGVYTPGQTYRHGAVATWDGSMWYA